MHVKKALFLSSMGQASLVIPGYGLRAETNQEEYKPLFPFGPGPFMTSVYTLIVCRKQAKGKYAEPHIVEKFYDVDKLVETLEAWKIDVEGWEPDESERANETDTRAAEV